MKTNPIIYAVLLLLAVSCGTLDPAGVYQGNKTLYSMDMTINTPYVAIDSFLQWELRYRTVLAAKPEIRKAADTLRVNAPGWFKEAVRLRDLYAGFPTPSNQSAFTQALVVINQAVTDVLSMMTQNANLTVGK